MISRDSTSVSYKLFLITQNACNQQKSWETYEIMKENGQNKRQISVIWTQTDYFSIDSAIDLT